jgi:hypothetical protein
MSLSFQGLSKEQFLLESQKPSCIHEDGAEGIVFLGRSIFAACAAPSCAPNGAF